MPILALDSTHGTLPSEAILVIFDSLYEVKTGYDGVRHIGSVFSGVSIHINFLVGSDLNRSIFAAGHSGSTFKQTRQKSIVLPLGSLLLFCLVLLRLESGSPSFDVAMQHLILDLRNIPVQG